MSGLEGADVKIYDVKDKLIAQCTTDNEGRISWLPVMWKQITTDLISTFTPHKIVAQWRNLTATVTGVNMSQNQFVRIILDDVPPPLEITYPPEGLITNSSQINIIGTTEPGARVTVNDEAINNIDGVINQTWWLNEGLNTLVIQARDAAGNVAEVIRNVTLDQTGPYVTIVEPPDGLVTNKNPIEVRGRTNGTRLEVAGREVEISPNGTFSTTFTFPFEGQHSIMAVAWDDAGNTGMHRVRVEWDATPPAIEIDSPQNGSLTNNKNLEIKGKVVGASVATLNGVPLDLRRDGAFEHPVELMEGENIFLIDARDAAGNENSTTLIVYLDTGNFIEILEPKEGALLNTSNVVVRGRTETGAAVSVNGIDAAVDDGSFSLMVDLNEGANKITAVSLDRAGNRAEATIRVTLDTTPPPIIILAPVERVLKIANVELRVQSEPGATVSINGEPVSGTGGIFALSVVLERGENRFVIEARDAAWNLNRTELVLSYLPPKPPPPTPSEKTDWLLPVVILVLIAAAGAGYIILRLRKRRMGEGPGPPGPP
ncbi:MAG: hypothetical protein QW379_06925 [Thermoplasmata archaeon]